MWFIRFSLIRRAVWRAGLGIVVLVLGACAAPSRPVTPLATSPMTEATVATPPSTAAVPSTPTAVAAATDWTDFESRTPDGLYERGNPEAPILIRDYSDFL